MRGSFWSGRGQIQESNFLGMDGSTLHLKVLLSKAKFLFFFIIFFIKVESNPLFVKIRGVHKNLKLTYNCQTIKVIHNIGYVSE